MTPASELARLLAWLESDAKPTPEEIAAAEAALSVPPKHPQRSLDLAQARAQD